MSGGTDKATNNNIVYGFIEGYDTYCPFDICNSPPPEPSVFLRRVEKPFGLELPPGKG